MKPANTKHQMDALLPPVVCESKSEDQLQLGQGKSCTPTKSVNIDVDMVAGFALQGSPLYAKSTTKLFQNAGYSTSAESNLLKRVSKQSAQLAAQQTVFRTGYLETAISSIGSLPQRDCLVLSTGVGSAKTKKQSPLVELISSPPVRQLTLFPPASHVYLPPKTQHLLLKHLQSDLELACYSFGERAMPEILDRHKWACAELVELNRWTGIFLSQKAEMLNIGGSTKTVEEFFSSIANIRHSAVHRLQISTENLEEFFKDAEDLLIFFGDDKRRSKVISLWRNVREIIMEESNDGILHFKVEKLLEELAAQSTSKRL
jgi:hypothetical protein